MRARLFASRDLLTQAALDRMLAGLSTRRYRSGLEAVGKKVEPVGTSPSSISCRFVTGTQGKLAELLGRDLSGLDLLAIFIDGIETADRTIVAALGVDADGHRHPLGLWEASTENMAVCRALLNHLVERGLDTERPIQFVIDGGKAARSVIKSIFWRSPNWTAAITVFIGLVWDVTPATPKRAIEDGVGGSMMPRLGRLPPRPCVARRPRGRSAWPPTG